MILQTIALDLSQSSCNFRTARFELASTVPKTVVLPLKLCPLLIPGRIELPLIAYKTIILLLRWHPPMPF